MAAKRRDRGENLRGDGKSAQGAENTGDRDAPWGQRVRKSLKTKGLNEKGGTRARMAAGVHGEC